jgi:hypothetical protein
MPCVLLKWHCAIIKKKIPTHTCKFFGPTKLKQLQHCLGKSPWWHVKVTVLITWFFVSVSLILHWMVSHYEPSCVTCTHIHTHNTHIHTQTHMNTHTHTHKKQTHTHTHSRASRILQRCCSYLVLLMSVFPGMERNVVVLFNPLAPNFFF